MAEPSAKKRKLASEPDGPVITDSRFTKFHSDPRYRLPGKKHHVKLDERFSRVLKDDEFSRRAKVDRYGRPVDTGGEKKRLKKRFEFEEDEDLAPDDDADVQKELQRVKKHDPLRDGRESASSSEESSSDEDSGAEEETIVLPEAQGGDIPKGEVTSRIAVVNLDWDNIRATDLMAVFSSFLPSTGRLTKVSVYPSDFGKERMEREEMEGPPKDIFTGKAEDYSDSESEADEDVADDEKIKDQIVKPDEGDEFDSAKLRQYQLERLRYYFAILDFSSLTAAKAVYDSADGAEYLSTANFFDLRFVPDSADFTSDIARDECTRVPEGYKPNEFITDALQHSKVKLTWDADDVTRKEVQARAFRGSRKDIDENDLKAYLGTDSSEEEKDNGDQATSTKEQERRKMRTLLGLGAEPAPKSKKEDKERPIGDLQITFSSGLSGSKDKKTSVFENEPEPNETTLEKYVRKERERKQLRKAKFKGTVAPDAQPEVEEDAGFDDPFFAEPSHDKASASKLRKEERLKRRAEREAEEKASAAKRAELELLMVDDKETEMRHFDINEIEKAERRAKKKGKKGKKSKEGGMEPVVVDNFDVDSQDPRFARMFENHELAIDPTHPRFKGTAGMKKLLDEGRKKRKHKGGDRDVEDASDVKHTASKFLTLGNCDTDVQKLVEKRKQ
jgi:hypothetical protein